MKARAGSWGIDCNWDAAFAEEAVAGQGWVLSAMRSYGPDLVAMLWRILGNEQDACDAYQDTFVQLAYHRNGQRPDNVKAFLFRSASNIAISMLRRRKVHAKACQALAKQETHAPSGMKDLDMAHILQELRLNVARLPERLRSVVILRDFAEMPYLQVARMLGITQSTARIYRCRAIRLLSARMKGEEGISK